MTKEYITIGKLGRTRGVDGEIWVTTFTDFPNRFIGMESILVKNKTVWETKEIEFAHLIGDRPVLKIKELSNPENASLWTNRELAITKDELVDLPEGEFYIFDLVGCDVFDIESGETIGVISDVEQHPANDVYLIETVNSEKARIAVVKQFVKSVDIGNKKVVVDPTGFIDQ